MKHDVRAGSQCPKRSTCPFVHLDTAIAAHGERYDKALAEFKVNRPTGIIDPDAAPWKRNNSKGDGGKGGGSGKGGGRNNGNKGGNRGTRKR